MYTLVLRGLDGDGAKPHGQPGQASMAREEALVLMATRRAEAEREAREIIQRRAQAGERIFSWQLVERGH